MKTAMILAAGKGERLKPLTLQQPKAMCTVANKPLIEHHVENLAKAGFQRIIINHAHLGGQIRHHLGNGKRWDIEIAYAPEPPGGLETGGGIFNALPLLGKAPFITVNADVFTDFNFNSLSLLNGEMTRLILVTNPQHNTLGDFDLTAQNLLCNQNKRYTFAGIARYHPQAFQDCRMGRYSVVSLLHKLIASNLATGELYGGMWIDIGTSERLKFANTLT